VLVVLCVCLASSAWDGGGDRDIAVHVGFFFLSRIRVRRLLLVLLVFFDGAHRTHALFLGVAQSRVPKRGCAARPTAVVHIKMRTPSLSTFLSRVCLLDRAGSQDNRIATKGPLMRPLAKQCSRTAATVSPIATVLAVTRTPVTEVLEGVPFPRKRKRMEEEKERLFLVPAISRCYAQPATTKQHDVAIPCFYRPRRGPMCAPPSPPPSITAPMSSRTCPQFLRSMMKSANPKSTSALSPYTSRHALASDTSSSARARAPSSPSRRG